MSEPSSQWRVNRDGMDPCCYLELKYEMYRRKGVQEELMREGDVLKCSTCNSEMICDPGHDGRLRWRWKGEKE